MIFKTFRTKAIVKIFALQNVYFFVSVFEFQLATEHDVGVCETAQQEWLKHSATQ